MLHVTTLLVISIKLSKIITSLWCKTRCLLPLLHAHPRLRPLEESVGGQARMATHLWVGELLDQVQEEGAGVVEVDGGATGKGTNRDQAPSPWERRWWTLLRLPTLLRKAAVLMVVWAGGAAYTVNMTASASVQVAVRVRVRVRILVPGAQLLAPGGLGDCR